MNDRILGYIVICIVTIFLILPIGYLLWQSQEPVIVRTIAFKGVTSLSFLSRQDPVRVKGVEVGVVRDITIKNSTAYVKIETDNSFTIFSNYYIAITAKGVMGDRYLTIQPGDLYHPVVPPDSLLYGVIGINIDDALPHIGKLKAAVHKLAIFSEQLKSGTKQRQSLITEIWQITSDLDSIFRNVVFLIEEMDHSLQGGFDSAIVILDKAMTVTNTLSDSLPGVITTFDDLSTTIDTALIKIESLYRSADTVVTKLKDPQRYIWKKHTDSVTNKLTKLQELFKEIQGDSLTLPVKLW